MRLLLDTNVFLWLITGDSRLTESMQADVLDPRNEVYLSAVSVWEASVKYQIGRLPLPEPPWDYLPVQRERHQIDSLQLDEACISRLSELPPLHRDPFDRMLVCQALERRLTLFTVDDTLRAYPVPTYG